MGILPAAPAPDWSPLHHRGPAKCRTVVPERGNDTFFDNEKLALEICNGNADNYVCPRRTECLLVAMLNCEPYGVWGGMTAKARLALRTRYPQMPERWTWRPAHEPPEEDEEEEGGALCRAA